MEHLYDYLRAVGDLLLPRVCLTCGRHLGVHENHLCLSCEADLPLTYYWLHAHNPLADRFNAVLERHRGTEPMDYAYAVALLHYKGPYRQIPRALKYHGNLAAGRHFGSMLGRRIATSPHLADIDLIIPVPLHWTRLRTRGYNQADILARALAASLNATRTLASTAPFIPGVMIDGRSESAMTGRIVSDIVASVIPGVGSPVMSGTPASVIPGVTGNLPVAACRTDLLVRARRTRTQTRLTVEQKAQNVASAFRVPSGPRRETSARKALASARHILLVDDTYTTGATLYACYAALRPYTSARISIATLAAVEGTPSAGP